MSRHKDNISGLFLLDKDQGLTSNKALQDVKHLINAKKAGHTGSLDPLATGLLPLCFGEATKLSSYLLDANKRYLASFKLGETTDTYDSEGQVTHARTVNVERQQIQLQMENMLGVIHQVPPMYSALKKDGKPLYELARQGVEVEREPRRVILSEFELIDFDGQELKVSIHCSSGFYVRSLAHDLGEVLECGAHVCALRRTTVGGLTLDDAITLQQLRDIEEVEQRQQLLKPADQVLEYMQAIELDELQARRLFQGQPIQMNGLPSKGLVRLYLHTTNQFLGVGLINQGYSIKPKRLINPESINF